MSEWKDVQLCNLANIEIGGTPSRDVPKYWATESDSGFPWVSISDLNKRIIFDTKERITESGIANSNVKKIAPGTLLVSFKLSIGRAAIAGLQLFTNEAIAAIVPIGLSAHPGFLYYVLPTVCRNAITETAVKGATLNKKALNKLWVTLPICYREQQKIARILQTIDQAIEKTEALIEKYQQIKAGLMHDLFTRGIGPEGQLRPPREQAPELYQETSIGWVPKGWLAGPLQRMSKPDVPHLKTGPFGSSLKGEHWQKYGVPVITIGSLGEGEFIHEELLYISENYANLLAEYRMKEGEVVFSRVADVGRSVVIEGGQDGWVMSSNLMRIHLDQGKTNPHFLQNVLSFDSRVRKQIRCKVNSSGRDVANGEILNGISFPWPPIEEQNEIVARAFSLDRKLANERNFLRVLQNEKSGLMHDLLTGKVTVQVDEPESESEAVHV